MINNPAHQEMIRRYQFKTMELFDSWVNTFVRLYKTYEYRVTNPNVAIIDFLDKGTIREFEEFARHFQKAGINCEICDIRELQFKNGKLYSSSGHIVDAVYRRAVTTDILNALEYVKPFIDAVRAGACFVAGSFCTQIIHHKRLFYVLRLPRTKEILTSEENSFIEKHIPYTFPFSKEYIDLYEVIKNKDKYILKPEDSYASKGVYAGIEYDQNTWEKIVENSYERGYICQEYCKQHVSYNIDFAWGDGKWHSYIDMTGLFVYDGKLAGIFSRSAEGNGIIASNRNERTQATYIVHKNKGC
ncbi:hypothetical protein IJJ97_01305, partial [bacterium]|nr:hypothetical protein [bacterium]